MQQYPTLYEIVRRKNQSVASVLGPLNVSFRRALVGDKLTAWLDLVSKVLNVTLTDANYSFVWGLTNNLSFTVKSLYSDMMQENMIIDKCLVWKLRLPLKIKVFLWYLKKGVLLTRDNLIKRKWKGESKCCFCNNNETIQHLFFKCHVAKFAWNAVFFAFGIQPPTSV